MTVHIPQERLSWKFTIPISIYYIFVLVIVWILPSPSELPSWVVYLARYGGLVGIPLIILGMVAWTIWGDV